MASYLKNLEELKDKYQDGIVSLLIGTGFSLNAYKEMPMWDILLLDMAKAFYGSTKSEDDLRAFILKDPTLIVTKFLETNERFKLDNYIEQHIPFFDNDLHAWVAPRTGTAPISKAILHDNDLYLHYHLLNGEWRNGASSIYLP